MMGEPSPFVMGGLECSTMMELVQHIFSQHSALSAQHHITGTLGLADGFSLFFPISRLFRGGTDMSFNSPPK